MAYTLGLLLGGFPESRIAPKNYLSWLRLPTKLSRNPVWILCAGIVADCVAEIKVLSPRRLSPPLDFLFLIEFYDS